MDPVLIALGTRNLYNPDVAELRRYNGTPCNYCGEYIRADFGSIHREWECPTAPSYYWWSGGKPGNVMLDFGVDHGE